MNADKLMDSLLEMSPSDMFSLPKYDGRPVVLYGAGQMGRLSLEFLKKANVPVLAILDLNPQNSGTRVMDVPVISPDQTPQDWLESALFAVSVLKVSYNAIAENLQRLGCKYVCYVGHLIETTYAKPSVANVWMFQNISQEEKLAMERFYSSLEDDASKCAYVQILTWLMQGKELPFEIAAPEDKYYIREVVDALGKDECFIDCGAYNGDSIRQFLHRAPHVFESCYSFEPDPENYKKLVQFVRSNIHSSQIKTFPFGLGNIDGKQNFVSGLGITSRYTEAQLGTEIEIHRLDTVLDGKKCGFIKIYGLGIGNEVIKGAEESIKKSRPIIAANIHHTQADFIKTPMFLIDMLDDYKIRFRLHAYCGSDAVVYAIPKERQG